MQKIFYGRAIEADSCLQWRHSEVTLLDATRRYAARVFVFVRHSALRWRLRFHRGLERTVRHFTGRRANEGIPVVATDRSTAPPSQHVRAE